MARYVDVEKLIAEYDRVHIGAAGGARKLMEEAPTADVQEVKHGEWVVEAYDDDNRMMIIPYVKHQHSEPFCSNCGKRAVLNGAEDYVTSRYCPHCGAKMGRRKRK